MLRAVIPSDFQQKLPVFGLKLGCFNSDLLPIRADFIHDNICGWLLGFPRHRICKETNGGDGTGGGRGEEDPEGWLFIAQYVFYSPFYTVFSKGKRTARDCFFRSAAADQCAGIRLPDIASCVLQDIFVAGELDIFTEKAIADPQKRIEPIDAKQQKAKRLPDRVMPFYMSFFMEYYIPSIRLPTIWIPVRFCESAERLQAYKRTVPQCRRPIPSARKKE